MHDPNIISWGVSVVANAKRISMVSISNSKKGTKTTLYTHLFIRHIYQKHISKVTSFKLNFKMKTGKTSSFMENTRRKRRYNIAMQVLLGV